MSELLSASALIEVLQEFSKTDKYNDLVNIIVSALPKEEQQSYQRIIAGEELPSLSSDIIAKKIFSAEEHKERVEYLLRSITGDPSIEVDGMVANEGYSQSRGAKKVIFDMPFKLIDNRRGDLEFQVAPQEYIMERAEIYSGDMLVAQYSVDSGQKKGDMDYTDVKDVIIIVFMKKSPKKFREFSSEHYIHRFFSQVSDTGLEYSPLRKIAYVQLDKALEQLKSGENAEGDNRLLTMLAAMADVNDEAVVRAAETDEMLKEIIKEVAVYVKDKEVQTMLLAE